MKNLSREANRDAPGDTRIAIAGAAERLFAQVGFQKTTVSDIAHELHMSPANIYRFFSSKAEIDETVARRLLFEMESAVVGIVNGPRSASEKLRACIVAIEAMNEQRFRSNRKAQELVEAAFNGGWPIVREHIDRINQSLSEIIAQGNRDGEFSVDESDLAAILVHSACIRFCHPRLMVEWMEDPEPTLDQMVDFCLVALK